MFSIQNPTTTFEFPGQEGILPDLRAKVIIRPLTADLTRKIVNAATIKRVEYKELRRNQPIQRIGYDDVDDNKIYADVWDYVIVDWVNINVDGEPFPCNRENKLLLLGNDNVFLSNLMTWRETIEADLYKSLEEREKNLLITSNGSTEKSPAINADGSTE